MLNSIGKPPPRVALKPRCEKSCITMRAPGIAVVTWRVVELRSAAVVPGGHGPGFRDALALAGKDRFPYAAAIALGVLATMWMRGLLRPLTGGLA